MNDQASDNRGGPASSSEAARRLPNVFPAAAQPDVVRASQKDELYLHYLIDACHDAVRRLLGPRRALLWNRETAVVGQILYYSLTTGAGVQTLGEEYCDILQVTGSVGLPPGTVRRGFLVLLQTLMPYLADKIGTSAEGPHTRSASWASHSQVADQTPAAQPHFASIDEQYVHQPSWTVSLDRLMKKIAGRWRSLWQVLSQYSGAAVRLHLALFYFYGLYYHWSKRATGVRYMFIGKLFEHRPSYHLLGVLLFIQLGITSASWAIRNLASLPGSASKSPEIEPSSSTTRQKERKAVVLEDDSTLAALSPVRLSEGDPPSHSPL
ncbi:hypothetical protein WJX79_009657 [Trebouxia sp. C0005]